MTHTATQLLYWKDFGFLVEVADGGFFGGASTDAKGLVLEDLEFAYVIIGGVRKPDRKGIGGNRTEEGVVGGEESLFLVAPFGASQTFKDFKAGGKFGRKCGNVGTVDLLGAMERLLEEAQSAMEVRWEFMELTDWGMSGEEL